MKANILIVEDERIIAYDIKNCLENSGYNVEAVQKGAGSVYQGLMQLKEYDIELADSPNGTKEFQNYCWFEKGGTILDQEPKGGFDHFIDGSRYSIAYLQPNSKQKNDGYIPIFTDF
jgi:hypothetical protein